MAARSGSRRGRAGFRPDPARAASTVPSRRQAVALLCVLLVVAGAIAAASFLARPDKARAFNLFYGSVYLDDTTAPVALDLASGKPTVQLVNAVNQVSANASDQLHLVPLTGGTLMLNTATGEFNMLDATGFVLKGVGGGVQLPPVPDSTAAGVASGSAAYIVQSSATQTAVYLVGQATVSAAAGAAGKTGLARATYGVDQGSSDVAGSAAAANGDLWLLTGPPTGPRTVRQLHVPAGSDAGVTLASTEHGTVSGAAAVASVGTPAGSGADAVAGGAAAGATGGAGAGTTAGQSVAVASAAGIEVFRPDGTSARAALPGGAAGLDSVLPAHGEQDHFAFLLHGATGWAVATAPLDGGSAAVHRITGIPASAKLIAPGSSEGGLYTMDTGTGRLWRVDENGEAAPVRGQDVYPITTVERMNHFESAYVVARGARVIYDAPQHDLALTVFTDGSSAPVIADKRSAISVNPTGPALSGLRAGTPGPTKPTAQPTGTPQPQTPVNEKIDCKKVSQIPHPPVVQLDERGSRSAQLSWTYPQLSPQDCLPSTYTVSITVVAGEAPPPPRPITVQGSTGVIVTGLFPDTQYQIVVTAYINGRGTPSQPLPMRTSVEGPAAPTNVVATTDDAGNWHVQWNSCGGIENGCVQTVQWRITPQVCGNTPGLVGAPKTVSVVGDPTLRSFSLTYPSAGGLLGRGLSFVVAGVGQTGVLGTPGTASSCTFSWQPPNAAAVHVAASQPPATSVGGSSSVTANLTFTGDPDVAVGGVGGQFTYQLLSGGAVVTTVGPTLETTADLSGVQPGQAYQVRVVVSPPRHPDASVAVGPVDVSAAVANWPALSASASFANDHYYDGTLTVNVGGITSAQARGETFDLTDNSMLRCGNVAFPLTATNVDPAQPLTFSGIDRSTYNGSCAVTVQLAEDAATRRTPAYFGGTPSPAVTSAPITLGPPDFVTTAGQFSAGFEADAGYGTPTVAVAFDNNGDSRQTALLQNDTGNWSVQLSNDGGATWGCGSSTQNVAAAPAELVTTSACVKNATGWKVRVSFTYFGSTPSALPFVIDVSSANVPKPVDPSKISFQASFQCLGVVGVCLGGYAVQTTYVYDNGNSPNPYPQSTFNALNWTITIVDDQGNSCGSYTNAPSTSGSNSWKIDTTKCALQHSAPGTGGGSVATVYTITLHFDDPFYNQSHDYTYAVPQS